MPTSPHPPDLGKPTGHHQLVHRVLLHNRSTVVLLRTYSEIDRLVERDRARVDATIVCESCLVRGRRSGSRPPTSSHDVGGLRGVCGGPSTRASACGVGWGGGVDWRATGWGCRPAGPTPRPRRAAPARRPVSLRRVLSRALRRLLPIATSCSLACVPPRKRSCRLLLGL